MRVSELKGASNEGQLNPFYVSFSDLMLLLCAFFVMLLGMSKINIGSFEEIKAGFTGTTEGTLVELAEKLQVISEGKKGVTVRMAEDGVRLDFESAALFDSGQAILKEPALKPLWPVLREVMETNYTVDVEGHTDDQNFFRMDGKEVLTNWSLSGRRSSAVVHFLIEFGFPNHRLRVVGYAANNPKVKIKNKKGRLLKGEALKDARSQNRRVSLLIR